MNTEGTTVLPQPIDAVAALRQLADLPHRAAGTHGERAALDLLSDVLRACGAEIVEEKFRTQKTYHVTLFWLIGLLLAGLWLATRYPLIGAVAAAGAFAMAVLYFDWRPSPATMLPPRVTSTNLVARRPGAGTASRKLILMAHTDSAPISALYRPSLIAGFHRSLVLSLALMALTALLALLPALGATVPLYDVLRIVLTLYLIVQLGLGSLDFLRLGYSNAANDNGSGVAVAVAVAVADRLWRETPPGWEVELALTGAEEAGMIGARAYFKRHPPDPARVWLINVDTVGCENLAVVERTGTLTDTVYHNALFDAAMRLARADARFAGVRPATHRLADFDSVWFARAGVNCVTLASYRSDGLMRGIHRPEDTLKRVSLGTVRQAADFAEALARAVMKQSASAASERCS